MRLILFLSIILCIFVSHVLSVSMIDSNPILSEKTDIKLYHTPLSDQNYLPSVHTLRKKKDDYDIYDDDTIVSKKLWKLGVFFMMVGNFFVFLQCITGTRLKSSNQTHVSSHTHYNNLPDGLNDLTVSPSTTNPFDDDYDVELASAVPQRHADYNEMVEVEVEDISEEGRRKKEEEDKKREKALKNKTNAWLLSPISIIGYILCLISSTLTPFSLIIPIALLPVPIIVLLFAMKSNKNRSNMNTSNEMTHTSSMSSIPAQTSTMNSFISCIGRVFFAFVVSVSLFITIIISYACAFKYNIVHIIPEISKMISRGKGIGVIITVLLVFIVLLILASGFSLRFFKLVKILQQPVKLKHHQHQPEPQLHGAYTEFDNSVDFDEEETKEEKLQHQKKQRQQQLNKFAIIASVYLASLLSISAILTAVAFIAVKLFSQALYMVVEEGDDHSSYPRIAFMMFTMLLIIAICILGTLICMKKYKLRLALYMKVMTAVIYKHKLLITGTSVNSTTTTTTSSATNTHRNENSLSLTVPYINLTLSISLHLLFLILTLTLASALIFEDFLFISSPRVAFYMFSLCVICGCLLSLLFSRSFDPAVKYICDVHKHVYKPQQDQSDIDRNIDRDINLQTSSPSQDSLSMHHNDGDMGGIDVGVIGRSMSRIGKDISEVRSLTTTPTTSPVPHSPSNKYHPHGLDKSHSASLDKLSDAPPSYNDALRAPSYNHLLSPENITDNDNTSNGMYSITGDDTTSNGIYSITGDEDDGHTNTMGHTMDELHSHSHSHSIDNHQDNEDNLQDRNLFWKGDFNDYQD